MRTKPLEFDDVWIGLLKDLMATFDAFMSWIISSNTTAAD